MLQASCHCGAVKIDLLRRPRGLTQCDCSICRRYAALWAYFSGSSLRFHHAPRGLATYAYKTGTFVYHRCRRCGCVTHYRRVNTSNDDRFAINARMLDPDEIASIPVRSLHVPRKKSSPH